MIPLTSANEENSQITSIIDTDDPEIMATRMDNHQVAEENLNLLKNLPAKDRLEIITDRLLLGIPNVRGDNPKSVRTNSVTTADRGFKYPNPEDLPELFENLLETIDLLYKNINEGRNTRDERSMMGIKLGTIVFTLGVLVHPYRDINGQRFLLLAESYIKELAPKKMGKHKKLNYKNENRTQIKTLAPRALKQFFKLSSETKDDDNHPDNIYRAPNSIEGVLGYLLNTQQGHQSLIAYINQYTTDPDDLDTAIFDSLVRTEEKIYASIYDERIRKLKELPKVIISKSLIK